MSDWRPGDLALCVDARHHESKLDNGGLVQGRIYTVDSVYIAPPWDVDAGKVGLTLRELPIRRQDTSAFRSWRFRKVTPPKADEFDREVIELMNRKPVEVVW